MSKKILILSILALLLTLLLSVKVSAATITSATIEVTPSKTECKAGETIDYTISLKNLNASDGILGLGAYIEYDSNLLTLNTKAQGLSDWSDATISGTTNRFVTTKETHSSNNEDILKITFTAKETTSNVETAIKLNRIEISNGTQYNINEVSSNKVTIIASDIPSASPSAGATEEPETESPSPTPSGDIQSPGESTSPDTQSPEGSASPSVNTVAPSQTPSASSQATNNDKTEEKLPQTGFYNSYLFALIILVACIAIILFVRMKLINSKTKKK